jgi:hypothetical protein
MHVPTATDTYITIEKLCFLCGPCRDVIRKGQVLPKAVKIYLECVIRETVIVPVLKSVARKRLVETVIL